MNIVSNFGVLTDYTGEVEYSIVGGSLNQDITLYDMATGKDAIVTAPAVTTGVGGVITDPVTYTGTMSVVEGVQSNLQLELIASEATAGLYTIVMKNPADGSVLASS